MSRKNTHIALKIIGVIIMLIAFPIVTESKPWYYSVLLFDIGLVLAMIPKFPKLKEKYFPKKSHQ